MPRLPLDPFILVLLVLSLFLCGCNESTPVSEVDDEAWSEDLSLPKADFTPTERLEVVTWPDYLPEDVLELFENSYGTRIETTFIGSNEDMLELLDEDPQRFDILTPSDYMVATMIGRGMLHAIDHDHVPNMENLDEDVRRVDYDPGLFHCVPLFRTSLGLGFNIKYVSGIPRSWDYFLEQMRNDYLAFRVGIVGEMRFALGIALLLNGHSPNSRNPDEIAAAGELLVLAVEHDGLSLYGADGGEKDLARQTSLLSVTWNGLGAAALRENSNVRFLLPEGKVLVTYDNFVISAESRNLRTAELFVDFLLTPQVIARMTNYNNFSNTIDLSRRFVKPIVRNGPGYLFPDEDGRLFLEDVGESIRHYQAAWNKVLAAKPNPSLIKLPLPRDGFFRSGIDSSDFVRDEGVGQMRLERGMETR